MNEDVQERKKEITTELKQTEDIKESQPFPQSPEKVTKPTTKEEENSEKPNEQQDLLKGKKVNN